MFKMRKNISTMRKCEKCGNFFPRDVFTCPHCGIIGAGWPRIFLGIAVLLIAVFGFGICVYQWHRGINSAWLPIISAIIAIPAGILGAILFFRGKMSVRAQKYKTHIHRTTDYCLAGYCYICGKLCEHEWDRCKCRVCGAKRDEQHVWDGCKCLRCDAERDEQHRWEGCECRICGKRRDEDHIWITTGDCTVCGGTGAVVNPKYDPADVGYDGNFGSWESPTIACTACNGSGGNRIVKCAKCGKEK